MPSTVVVGSATDTGPTYTLTLTRDPNDTVTDWTTCTAVTLVFDGGQVETVTKTTATASQWTGTARYNAWFTTPDVYTARARATFADGTILTVPTPLAFSIGD